MASTAGSGTGGQAGEAARRVALPETLFAISAVVAFGTILYLGRSLTFWADEWAVITSRSLFDPASWVSPFQEHWVALLVIAYRALFDVVGLRSYLPYLAVLLALHVAVASAIFYALRRANGPWVALGGAALMLFLGSGFEDLFWAMQIGFVGAAALGTWALICLDGSTSRRASLTAALLLTAAVATVGPGLFFLAAAGVLLLADRRRWRRVGWLALPAGTYLVWFLAFGRQGMDAVGRPFSLAAWLALPGFMYTGLSGALGAISGLGPVGGTVLLGTLIGITGWHLLFRRPIPPLALAASAGLLTEYVLIGLVRDGLGDWASQYTRYVYFAAIFALLLGSALLGHVRLGPHLRVRIGAILIGVLALDIALVINVDYLVQGAHLFQSRADLTRAIVAAELQDGGAPGIDPTRSLGISVPGAASLRVIVAAHGSPLHDDLLPGVVPPVPTAVIDRATTALLRSADPNSPQLVP